MNEEIKTWNPAGGGIHSALLKQVEIMRLMAESLSKIEETIKIAVKEKEEIKPIHAHRVEALRKIEKVKEYIRLQIEEAKADSALWNETEKESYEYFPTIRISSHILILEEILKFLS